jgi:hypothetical protein
VSESDFLKGSVARAYLTNAAIRQQQEQVCIEKTVKPPTCDTKVTGSHVTSKGDDCKKKDEPPKKPGKKQRSR